MADVNAKRVLRAAGWVRFIGVGATVVVAGLATLAVLVPVWPQVVVVPVVLWVLAAVLANAVDSATVHSERTRCHRVYTGLIVTLPIVSCLWMILGWIVAAIVHPWLQGSGVLRMSSDRLLAITITIPALIPFVWLSVQASLLERVAEQERVFSRRVNHAPRWGTVLVFPVAAIAIVFAAQAASSVELVLAMSTSIALGSLVVERACTLQMVLNAPAIWECVLCGYDMRGLKEAVCPECGHARW